MSAAIIQSATRVTINNTDPKTITFAGAMTTDSWLIVMVSLEDDTTISSVSDSTNGSYGSPDVTRYNSYGTAHATAAIYKVKNTSTTIPTITVDLSAASWGSIWAYEVSGLDATTPLDASGTWVVTTDVDLSFTVTPATANCAIFSVGSGYSSTGITADSGYTAASESPIGINNQYSFGEYNLDVGASGTKTLTYSSTGNKQGSAVAVAYKLSGAGGGAALVESEWTPLEPQTNPLTVSVW